MTEGDDGPAVPDLHEFRISGTIGAIIADCLPELHIVTETPWTVLTGTVDSPEELRRVLDLLSARGSPAVDIRMNHPR